MCRCRKSKLGTRRAFEHVLEDGTATEYETHAEAAAQQREHGGVVRAIRVPTLAST